MGDLLQHLRHLQRYRSEYTEYATTSFRICRICNKIVQNMRQYRSEYATVSFRICNNMIQNGSKLWICPELSVSSKCFHPFCHIPYLGFVVNEERLQRLLSFQKDLSFIRTDICCCVIS